MDNLRIGVATARGRPFFGFVSCLRRLGLRFEPLLPREIPAYAGDVVLTTRAEAPGAARAPMLYEDVLGMHATVVAGLILQKADPNLEAEELVMGVDPGGRPGLSVSYRGVEIESSLHASPGALASHMAAVMAGLGAVRKTVRIGRGNMPAASEIGSMLGLACRLPFELEFVDERRTSPRARNCNQRGKRDRLSARYISQRAGRRRPPRG